MLLEEYLPFQGERVGQSPESSAFFVQGIIQRAGTKNQNKRVYSKDILEREVKKYDTAFIKQRRALGELDHPDSSIVSLQNVSHLLVEVWWDGNDLYGKFEILPTPAGNILKQLIEAKITIGVSSRGRGSVEEARIEGELEAYFDVQDDFELICFDFVSDPSTEGAFPKQVTESRTFTRPRERFDLLISQIICDIQGVCKCY